MPDMKDKIPHCRCNEKVDEKCWHDADMQRRLLNGSEQFLMIRAANGEPHCIHRKENGEKDPHYIIAEKLHGRLQ